MLELALNHVTISIAAALLVTLIVLFFKKRKQLSKVQKMIICCVGAIFAIYFVFVAILVFAFGNTHPSGGPKPVENLASQNLDEISFDEALGTVKVMYPEPLICGGENGIIDKNLALLKCNRF